MPKSEKPSTIPNSTSSSSSSSVPPNPSQSIHLTTASWVFGGLFAVFLMGVFMFAPNELPEFRLRLIAFFCALLAGLMGFFITGDLSVRANWSSKRFGKIAVQAGGGLAAFVLVLLWWLSPWPPVDVEVKKELQNINNNFETIVELLRNELEIKNNQIAFLQTQLDKGSLPTPSKKAQELAESIPDTADSYALALKAIAQQRYNDARRLLDELIKAQEAVYAKKQEAIEEDKKTLIRFYGTRAHTEYYAGAYEQMLLWSDKWIALDPKNARAFIFRGVAYSRLKDNEQAIQDYDHAIALDPKYALAFVNRGTAYAALKDRKQAIQDYDHAIALDPKNADAFTIRGIAYADLMDHKRAIQDYAHAIALDPKFALAFVNRGTAYAALKDYKQAIQDYDQAIVLDPKEASAFNNRGWYFYQLKQYKEALVDVNTALDLDPNKAAAYDTRGSIYLATQRYKQAIADFRRALALAPDLKESQAGLAQALKAQQAHIKKD